MSDNRTTRWQWSAIIVSLLAVPAFAQGQTLMLRDTTGWSLDILRPKLQEPGVLIKSGAPDAEFRARSERMFREWVADWPREQLARQLTDADLKAAKAALLAAEAALATAKADHSKAVTGFLGDWRRYLFTELTRPAFNVDLPKPVPLTPFPFGLWWGFPFAPPLGVR
jgi:hypothetical protein